MENVAYYQFDVDTLGIAEEDGAITRLFFTHGKPGSPQGDETALLKETASQLHEYFAGQRTEFTLPLNPRGTEFQRLAWQALQTIPYGQTRSYKQMAEQIGRSKAFRAVGLANNRNPITIVIPCHRVIGHNGSLVGYGGGLDLKQRLLELEQGLRG